MTTYTWRFPTLETVSTESTADAIKVIHWVLVAESGEHRAEVAGSFAIPDANPENFTPYADISEAWVMERVNGTLNADELKAGLDEQLAARAKPPLVSKAPPFGA